MSQASKDTAKLSRRGYWGTIGVAIVLILGYIVIILSTFAMPTDGWLVDRGAWGRYKNPRYLANLTEGTSELHVGDVLLAIEGRPFDVLERQAAQLRMRPPEYWNAGSEVRYTVLREGERTEIKVQLQRVRVFELFKNQFLGEFPSALMGLVMLFIGTLVLLLRPHERAAHLLFLFGLAFFGDDLMNRTLIPPGVADLFSPVTYWPKIILGNMSWVFPITPILTHMFLIFPVVQRPMKRNPQRTLLILYGAAALLGSAYVLLNVSGIDLFGLNMIIVPGFLYLGVIALSLVRNLFTLKDPTARLQARWLAFGGTIGLAGSIAFWMVYATLTGGVPGDTPFSRLVYMSLFSLFPASLAIAILRYRLWDIEVIIRKTLVYGSLTAVLVGIYFGSVVALQGVLRSVTGQQSTLAVVFSTLMIAAIFSPLRGRVQTFIDRRFYRRKYDAQRILTRFGRSARDEVDLDVLTDELIGVVDTALKPERVTLWLNNPKVD